MKFDDPVLTAYALGEELSTAERERVEALLAESAEARAFVEETKEFAGLLSAEFQAELQEPVEKVVPFAPEPPVRGGGSTIWWGSAAAAVATLLVVGTLAYPGWVRDGKRTAKLYPPEPLVEAEVAPTPPPMDPTAVARVERREGSDQTEIAKEASKVQATAPVGNSLGDQIAAATTSKPSAETFQPPQIPSTPLGTASLRESDALRMKVYDSGGAISANSGQLTAAQAATIGQFTGKWDGRERGARLSSAALHSAPPPAPHPGERYGQTPENPFATVAQEPLSTFSLDVDTASYSNARRMLLGGNLPPPQAVRLEEMVNYFDYDDPLPKGNQPLAVRIESSPAPWKPEHRLVRIGVKAREISRDELKGVNLVFLIDTSGSMSAANKLPLLKQSFELLLDRLSANDRVAIVTYAGTSKTALASTPVSEKQKIREVIRSLNASGGTNGAGGLEKAYQAARAAFIEKGVNRVILATDGDFNIGLTRDEELQKFIEGEAKSGVYLTVLGFGMGNLNDRMMKMLSTKGNGNYAYIDTVNEAKKVLSDQMRGTLVTVAKDVKLQVEFNPAKVQGYRLLGYENRMLTSEEFNDDTKDAGDLGAGHHVTALYEVVPTGLPPAVDPLKYQPVPEAAAPATNDNPEWLTVKVRYKAPEGTKSERMEFAFTDSGKKLEEGSNDLRFAAAVAQYAMLLSQSPHAKNTTWPEVLTLAEGALGPDPHGYRAEFLMLATKAEELMARQPTSW